MQNIFTKEQLKYINFKEKKHTKLLACAGSGKTKCIIGRMEKLINDKIFSANEILMLTFSRFTRDDFLKKLKKDSKITENTVKTIDSFAKTVVDKNNTIDVSLLSYSFMQYLKITDSTELIQNEILRQIKIIFIDEAQDLDEIQNNIFCLLKDKLEIIINMVGDPNQNIFQFRASSDRYLREFNALTFKLTHNFRSHKSVIEFSKHLRPFNEDNIICTKGDNGCIPSLCFYENEKILEEQIIDILNNAQEEHIDLSKFAILSPTRGRMRGGGMSHGLCFISNILFKAKIKFKQFYEESTDEISEDGIKYAPEDGHVNILTYMGSKGLEWEYVIIIDADNCLINKRDFNKDKHDYDRFLLYVACSRAVNNMYIFSRCIYKQGGIKFETNRWFKEIPSDAYIIDSRFEKDFLYSDLKYNTHKETETRLSKIIDRLNHHDLNELSEIIGFQSRKVLHKHKIFSLDYSTVEKHSGIFLSKFVINLFHALYNIKTNKKPDTFQTIENIINLDNADTNKVDSYMSLSTIEWYSKNRKLINSWEKFDADNTIQKDIKSNINSAFDRKKPFNTHVISHNSFYGLYILNQEKWIKNIYKKYLKCKNTTQIKEILFYLIVILHSIDTQHYYHIKSKGNKYSHLLNDFEEMFDDIEQYIDTTDNNFVQSSINLNRWGINSRADLLDDMNNIWSLKCTSDISLKHTLHSIVSSLMNKTEIIDDDFTINTFEPDFDCGAGADDNGLRTPDSITVDTNFINLLKGEEITYRYELSTDAVRQIIYILTKHLTNN